MAHIEENKAKRADDIQLAKIKADKELALKEVELQAHAQVNTDATSNPPPNSNAKSPKLPAFMDEKDQLDSYLLRFKSYAKNATFEKKHVRHQAECITVRKSKGCIHQDEEGTLDKVQFYW